MPGVRAVTPNQRTLRTRGARPADTLKVRGRAPADVALSTYLRACRLEAERLAALLNPPAQKGPTP